ncbi:hypothetical protein ACNKHU_05600 [Shigella flexneri]
MSMAQTAHSQFEQAYQLAGGSMADWRVTRRGMSLERLREKGVDQRHLAEQVQPLRM